MFLRTHFYLLLGFQMHHFKLLWKLLGLSQQVRARAESSREPEEPWLVPLCSPRNWWQTDFRHNNTSLPQGSGVNYQGINSPSPASPPCSTALPNCTSYITFSHNISLHIPLTPAPSHSIWTFAKRELYHYFVKEIGAEGVVLLFYTIY